MLWAKRIEELKVELATVKARLAEAEGLLQLIMERTLRIDVGVWQVSWSGNLLDDMMNSLSPTPPSPSTTKARKYRNRRESHDTRTSQH